MPKLGKSYPNRDEVVTLHIGSNFEVMSDLQNSLNKQTNNNSIEIVVLVGKCENNRTFEIPRNKIEKKTVDITHNSIIQGPPQPGPPGDTLVCTQEHAIYIGYHIHGAFLVCCAVCQP